MICVTRQQGDDVPKLAKSTGMPLRCSMSGMNFITPAGLSACPSGSALGTRGPMGTRLNERCFKFIGSFGWQTIQKSWRLSLHATRMAAVASLMLFVGGACSHRCKAQETKPTAPHQFRTMLVGTLSLPDEDFLKFLETMQPEVVVMGAFGAPQWVAQDDPREWIDKWRAIFARMHRSNIKVVGMIELLNVGNSPAEAMKFIDFFNSRWDEKLLGQKPKTRAIDLLEVRAMPPDKQTGAHAPRGCAVNPHWLAVEKAFVKALINAGIDGFITHRNMFGECGCPFCHAEFTSDNTAKHKHAGRTSTKPSVPHTAVCIDCQNGFRNWLAGRFDKQQLAGQLGIKDLNTHRLPAIYGHHRDHEQLPTALQLEGMKYARHAIKYAYDEVFVKFGRSVKRDLLLAQWNHMPYFDELHLDGGHIPVWNMTTFAHASANERWSLPLDLWGKGEDWFWYCNWGTCQNTKLDKRFLADITLYAKLLRSFARGKPYVINKYDFYRPRNMMAEAAALGMMAGAIAVPYRTEADREVMQRYMQFLKTHADLFANQNGKTVADVLLVHPRTALHDGVADGLEMIEVAGRTMLTEHIQFDFVPDDLLPDVDLSKYKAIVATDPVGLNTKLAEYQNSGGHIIAVPRNADPSRASEWKQLKVTIVPGLKPHTGGTVAAKPFLNALLKAVPDRVAEFDAPYTIEPHVYRKSNRYVIHLVNYSHNEKATGRAVVEREAPIATPNVGVRLRLKMRERVKEVTFLDPDSKREQHMLKFGQTDSDLRFQTPSFLTYGVCVVELEVAD